MNVQSIIVAASSLCGVLLGVGLQYLFGRALETRKQMALQRSLAYVDYFRAVATIAQNGRSKETLSLAADAKARICIYGSAKVIERLWAFETAGANTASDEGRSATVQLVTEMRADVAQDRHAINADSLQSILFGLARDARYL